MARGYGAQTRYDVTVEVAGQSFAAAVGFRTAELSTTPDAYGTGFSLVINGTPIYVRGFNWIPDDALLTRLDTGQLPHLDRRGGGRRGQPVADLGRRDLRERRLLRRLR